MINCPCWCILKTGTPYVRKGSIVLVTRIAPYGNGYYVINYGGIDLIHERDLKELE